MRATCITSQPRPTKTAAPTFGWVAWPQSTRWRLSKPGPEARHAAAGAVGEGDDAVDVRVVGEDAGGASPCSAARRMTVAEQFTVAQTAM